MIAFMILFYLKYKDLLEYNTKYIFKNFIKIKSN